MPRGSSRGRCSFHSPWRSANTTWWCRPRATRGAARERTEKSLAPPQDQAVQGRESHELAGGVHVELAVDAGAVRLHRLHADAELAGDALVGEPAHRQIEHLALAHR